MALSYEERLQLARAYKKRNREKMNEYRRKWMAANPERKAQYTTQEKLKDPKKFQEANIKAKRKWRAKNREYDRIYSKKIRSEVLTHYGGKCACCNESYYEFLAIDHMNGFGSRHRRELKIEGQKFIFWLKRSNYPEGFQVLCHNCNMAIGFNGYCPHHPEIIRPVSRRKQ